MDNRKFIYIAGGGLALIIVLIIVLLLVSSCGKKDNNKSDISTLTIWGTADDASAFKQIINDFQNTHTGTKVEYVKKDTKDYLTNSLAEIAAGRGPNVWIIPNTWLPKYHDQLVALPADTIADKKAKKSDIEVYQSTFPKVVSSDNIIDNQIYGMPMSTDTLRLYFNNAIFSDAISSKTNATDRKILASGPENWDQVIRAVQILTKKSNDTITQSAIALGSSNIINANDILTLLMLQNGAQMTSADNSAAEFHTATNLFGGAQYPGTKALDFYASFTNSKNDNYTWNDSLGDSVRAFAEGKSAMMIGYKSQAADIKRISPKLSYQTLNVPQVKETKNIVNFASYDTLTVTKAAKDSKLAWSFITFATSSSNVSQYLVSTKEESALAQNSDNNTKAISTAQNWYVPDPIKTPDIFKQMIKTVNDGGNSQTAIENAASQVTTLLIALKQ